MHIEPNALYRLKQFLTVLPISKVTFYNGLKSGRFQIKPIKNGRCVFYRGSDILELLESIASGV